MLIEISDTLNIKCHLWRGLNESLAYEYKLLLNWAQRKPLVVRAKHFNKQLSFSAYLFISGRCERGMNFKASETSTTAKQQDAGLEIKTCCRN